MNPTMQKIRKKIIHTKLSCEQKEKRYTYKFNATKQTNKTAKTKSGG